MIYEYGRCESSRVHLSDHRQLAALSIAGQRLYDVSGCDVVVACGLEVRLNMRVG